MNPFPKDASLPLDILNELSICEYNTILSHLYKNQHNDYTSDTYGSWNDIYKGVGYTVVLRNVQDREMNKKATHIVEESINLTFHDQVFMFGPHLMTLDPKEVMRQRLCLVPDLRALFAEESYYS